MRKKHRTPLRHYRDTMETTTEFLVFFFLNGQLTDMDNV